MSTPTEGEQPDPVSPNPQPEPNPKSPLNGNGDDEEPDFEDEEQEEEDEYEDVEEEHDPTPPKSEPRRTQARMENLARRMQHEAVSLRVHDVIIKGNTKTKDYLIEAELEPIKAASTVQELLNAARVVNFRLQALETFDSVNITLDAGPRELPGTANVIINVVETVSPLSGQIGAFTRAEARSSTMEASLKYKNLFGHGDLWDGSLVYGCDHSAEVSAGVHLPRFKGLVTPVSARVYLLSQDWLKYSSYKERALGLSLGLVTTKYHDVAYNLAWRTLTDPSQMSSSSIRRQLGHGLLSSLKYTFKIDRRNSSLRPTRGYVFASGTQIGGLAPDSRSLRFLRQELDLRYAFPLGFYRAALNVGISGGVIFPWGAGFLKRPSPLPERFFLGGNISPALFANTDPWRPSKNTDDLEKKSSSQSHYSTVFSENQTSSEVLSQLDDPLPVMFDDSDGSSSDIEEDKSKLVGSNDHGTFPREQIVHSENSDQVHAESHEVIECSFSEKGEGRSSKLLSRPSSVYSNAVEVHNDRNQKVEVGAESERKFNYSDKTTTKSSSGIRKSQNDKRDSFSDPPDEGNYQKSRFSMVHEVKDDAFVLELADTMKDTEVLTESTVESGKELKFGPLTGGLRNKGYGLPPYRKSSPGNASGSKQAAEDTSWKVELSSQTVKGSVSTGAHSQEPHNQKVSAEANKKTSTRSTVTYHESSDVDSGDELPQQTSSSSGESYNRKAVAEESKISSSRASVTCIDSEKSDFEDDFPKQTLTGDARPNARFSHRTKPSAPNSRRSLYPKTTVLSEMHSDHWRSSGQPRLQEQTASETVSESKRSLREESLKASARGQAVSESKRSSREESLKSSAREPPIHLPKIVTSGSTETSKSSSSSSESPSGEKPSHVHPKLPDYDSITEHLQSLRKNQP